MGNVVPFAKREQREIHTREGALLWGDEWEAAYHALRRQAHLEISEQEWNLLMAQSDLQIEQCGRLLDRHAFEAEIARLRGLLE